jgi:hypothetical protein
MHDLNKLPDALQSLKAGAKDRWSNLLMCVGVFSGIRRKGIAGKKYFRMNTCG